MSDEYITTLVLDILSATSDNLPLLVTSSEKLPCVDYEVIYLA